MRVPSPLFPVVLWVLVRVCAHGFCLTQCVRGVIVEFFVFPHWPLVFVYAGALRLYVRVHTRTYTYASTFLFLFCSIHALYSTITGALRLVQPPQLWSGPALCVSLSLSVYLYHRHWAHTHMHTHAFIYLYTHIHIVPVGGFTEVYLHFKSFNCSSLCVRVFDLLCRLVGRLPHAWLLDDKH